MSIRLRGIGALLAMIVFAAGVLPACAEGMCCPMSQDDLSMHAQMPCCAKSETLGGADDAGSQPAAFARIVKHAPAIVFVQPAAETSPARVQAAHDIAIDVRPEPSPPLFLLNAQFLI